jgi:hypothetical protein
MRWLSLFLACQHLKWETNLRECEDQSWFKVQAFPVFRFYWCKMFLCAPVCARTVGWRPLHQNTTSSVPILSSSSICNLIIRRHVIAYINSVVKWTNEKENSDTLVARPVVYSPVTELSGPLCDVKPSIKILQALSSWYQLPVTLPWP